MVLFLREINSFRYILAREIEGGVLEWTPPLVWNGTLSASDDKINSRNGIFAKNRSSASSWDILVAWILGLPGKRSKYWGFNFHHFEFPNKLALSYLWPKKYIPRYIFKYIHVVIIYSQYTMVCFEYILAVNIPYQGVCTRPTCNITCPMSIIGAEHPLYYP